VQASKTHTWLLAGASAPLCMQRARMQDSKTHTRLLAGACRGRISSASIHFTVVVLVVAAQSLLRQIARARPGAPDPGTAPAHLPFYVTKPLCLGMTC
jgi:hypothetical protein